MLQILKNILFGSQGKQASMPRRWLTKSLDENIGLFKEIFHDDQTIVFRYFQISQMGKRCCLIFADGMTDKERVNKSIIERIIQYTPSSNPISGTNLIDELSCNAVVTDSLSKVTEDLEEVVEMILYGDSLLLVDGCSEGLLLSSKGWPSRSVTEPSSEKVVRGPREGFTEVLNVNITLIRRKILNPDLKFHYMKLGRQTRTRLAICYMEGIASPKILNELIQRLKRIDLDGILESGYIEELIKDSPTIPFKTIGYTERPDIVAAKLLEGRVVLLCDGTPFALTVPFLFIENFQANEDYYRNYMIASVQRFLRFLGFFLSTSIPAIYVALITYHKEMVPTPLLLSIYSARQGVPFPTVLEAILLGTIFELLREGGVRLPAPIGQAISIVGAIILGDAAVNAKLVSAPIIIVTALTGISAFLVPQMMGVTVLIRIIFLLLASVFGLFGYFLGMIGLMIQLFSMRSFGVLYMTTWGKVNFQEIKDTVVRAPWWVMYTRPYSINQQNQRRQTEKKLPERE